MGDFNQFNGVTELPTSSGPIYLCNRVKNRIKGQYEDWLEGRARKRVFEQYKSGHLEQQEYKESMLAVQSCVAAGTFSWGGEAMDASLKQVPGLIKMICLLANDKDVKQQHPEQQVDETRVLNIVKEDETNQHVLVEFLNEVVKSTPNFMSPPVRGMED